VRIRFHEEARIEFLAAAEWYESERPGLGDEFLDQIGRALETIAAQPRAWPTWAAAKGTDFRRFAVPRFPYSVIFAARGEELFVLAVAHGRRRPGYWTERLDQST
jgi:toxin ParE1/3/4